ncbi:MBL fold metallo-hydrolase [Legionella saoudiensis]|uniref:MBL fold metallo-hydrolase n=1 Tax=Legionella saoudiensis TaxID=1750561 RepID=UPI00073109F2|nr:MBL fold metallo-hydrolase [Legionella saoudiensis]
MKLLFLGTASGLGSDLLNYQSNMLLLTDNGKKLLIDCGTDIRFSLTKANYTAAEIDAVYISHLHADHVGGMEWFALQRKFVSQNGKPTLIIHEQLADMLWEHSLSGGLKTLNEVDATLNDFFSVQAIPNGQIFEWEGLRLNLIKTVHVHSNGCLMPSYGLDIAYQGKKFFITADTQFTPDHLKQYYEEATIVFHDCETLAAPSGVHAHFDQLTTLAPEIRAKMWLYHYNDGVLPEVGPHGFRGFARCGQIIDLS